MQTLERINGTYVRHNWKAVTAGLAEGKAYSVENHGKREAVVLPPGALQDAQKGGFDVGAHFARVRRLTPVTLESVNAALARSPE
jgi:hypothetical protein